MLAQQGGELGQGGCEGNQEHRGDAALQHLPRQLEPLGAEPLHGTSYATADRWGVKTAGPARERARAVWPK